MSYEILIEHAETGTCHCEQCEFGGQAGSHADVVRMRQDAAQHVYVTGHTVDERIEDHEVVRPRSAVSY
jgi:hypothetical protein